MHTAIDHYRVDEESRGENKVKDVKDDFIKVNNFVKDGVKGKLGSSFRDSNQSACSWVRLGRKFWKIVLYLVTHSLLVIDLEMIESG